jgi:hypothetical protein
MDGAKIMGFHAPLGTAHRRRGLRNVQFLPRSQEERLLLPEWQGAQGLIESSRRPFQR